MGLLLVRFLFVDKELYWLIYTPRGTDTAVLRVRQLCQDADDFQFFQNNHSIYYCDLYWR